MTETKKKDKEEGTTALMYGKIEMSKYINICFHPKIYQFKMIHICIIKYEKYKKTNKTECQLTARFSPKTD